MHKDTYAGDREWLNARGKKSLRSARLHLCSLSLASLLLRSLALSIVTVQRSLPIVPILALYNDLYQAFQIDIYIYIFTYTSSDSTAYAARLFASR